MDDVQIRDMMERVVAEEQELRTHHQHRPLDKAGMLRLRELEKSLDQCWDLVRQRRAQREFGLDPDRVVVRNPEIVGALPAAGTARRRRTAPDRVLDPGR